MQPENIMLKHEKGPLLKLIDFGLSRKILPGEEVSYKKKRRREKLSKSAVSFPERKKKSLINYAPLRSPYFFFSLRHEGPRDVGYPGVRQPGGGQLRAALTQHGHVEHRRHHLHPVRLSFWGRIICPTLCICYCKI